MRFLDEEDIARLTKLEVLSDSIAGRAAEVTSWNGRGVDDRARQRASTHRLRSAPMTFLSATPTSPTDDLPRPPARPGPEGLPIEIYVFSKEQRWVQYEGIIGDIFDYVIASLPTFGLRPFSADGRGSAALAAATGGR